MADFQLSATLIGAEELKQALASGGMFGRLEVATALNKAADDVQNVAVSKAPKQTGALKSSIHTQYADENTLTAKVGTNLVYARAQEFGTQGMTIHSKSRTGTPFTYTGNIKPKNYMKQAFESVKQNFSGYLQLAVQHIVSHLAGR